MEGVNEPMEPELSVEVDERGGEVAVRIRGELDLTNAGQLERAIEPLFARVSLDRLVFDLAELRFMDSSGIAVLLRAAGRAGEVRLRSPSPLVEEVVSATGLADVLRVER